MSECPFLLPRLLPFLLLLLASARSGDGFFFFFFFFFFRSVFASPFIASFYVNREATVLPFSWLREGLRGYECSEAQGLGERESTAGEGEGSSDEKKTRSEFRCFRWSPLFFFS